jgi:hypothetical protein
MARTALTYQNLNYGVAVVDSGISSAADATNGQTIANSFPERTVLRVSNSGGAAENVIVRAGTKPLAESSGQGDLTVSVPAGEAVFIGPLESARYIQADGSLSIDYAAGYTGAITAFQVASH